MTLPTESDNVSPLPKGHVSFSELTAFRTGCHWRWELDNVDLVRKGIFSIHLDFGTAVHSALERYFEKKNPIDISAAIDLFEKTLRDLVYSNFFGYREKELQSLKKGELESLVEAGKNIISDVSSRPEFSRELVVACELPIYEKMSRSDGVDVSFKGFIDLVIRAKSKRGKEIIYIVDFKTSNNGWRSEQRRDFLKHRQLFLYKHFFCKKTGLDPELCRTAFLIMKKRAKPGSTLEFLPISAGPVVVQRALDQMAIDVDGMVSYISSSPKGPSREERKHCVNDFGDICPYYSTPHCPGRIDEIDSKIASLSPSRRA